MKNIPLNEKHLAGKLQNVPVPDVEPSWEQMRRLLDREMPEPVAGAWSGNRKWWWMGITALVVMVAAWLATPLGVKEGVMNKSVSKNKMAENLEKKAGVNSNKKVKVNDADPDNKVVVNADKAETPDTKTTTLKITAHPDKIITSGNKTAFKQTQLIAKRSGPTRLDKPAFSENNISDPEATFINTILASTETPNPSYTFTEIQTQTKPLATPGKTDKAFAREVRKKSIKADNRRMSKSSMRGNSKDKEHEITFAAGLALPYSMPVSGQQSPSYNIAAKSTRLTDYLPAPFFQYHVNDKVFLQTELQFQAPQHTQRLLLSQSVDTFFNMRYEKTEHLEKLYYFNIPFNVYYSPLRNFYIGGGLQYSSLLGGIATYEDRSTNGQNVVTHNSITRRFKDDSAAAVFSPSEWRYQFDANYYLNRFSFGLRYNQSMKDYINVQVGPGTSVGRNRSFLLYVRFNIWEERKKTAN